MTIWYIDDDALQLELTAAVLSKSAPSVTAVPFQDARDALAEVQALTPDLILLDLNMPFMNGWEFMESLQNLQISLPIVIVTSSIDPRDKLRAKTYSCVRDFFVKPLRVTDVAQLLHGS